MWTVLVGGVFAAPCEAIRSPAELDAALAAFATAHDAQSLHAMAATASLARSVYTCMATPASPDEAARFHMMEAWMALGRRTEARKAKDPDAAQAAQDQLDAATAAAWQTGVDVGDWLPTAPSQPVRQSYAGAGARVAAATASPLCADSSDIVADGVRPATTRTSAAASLLQRVDGHGAVVDAIYAWPDEDTSQICPPEKEQVEVDAPTEVRIYVGAGAVVGSGPSGLATGDSDVVRPGSFAGVGPVGALGLTIPISPAVRVLTELGYAGGLVPLEADDTLQAANFGTVLIAMELGSGWARLAFGPGLTIGAVSVRTAGATADGAAVLAGGELRPGARFVDAGLKLDGVLRGGFYTDGERVWMLAGAGLQLGL